MKTKSFYKAILAAAGVYTLWGFSFLASSVGQRVATPFVLLSYRFDIALLILLVPLVLGKAKLRLRGKNVKMLLLLNLTTVVSVLAGVFILGDRFSLLSAISMVAVMVGIWGVQKFTPKENSSQ